MDEEEIKVSKNFLKTLTVDTRTDILKSLSNRPMTASELSRKLSKHVTTISEHLQNLRNSNLVERVERPGRKWVYYRLTKPGKSVIHPESYRWVFVFIVTFLTFVGGLYFVTANSYPGDPLYALKRNMENLQLALTTDSLKRAELHIQRADTRLEETKNVVKKGKADLVGGIVKDYQEEIKQAKVEIEIAKKAKRDIIPTLEVLSESTAKQSTVLENLAIKSPAIGGKVQPALAISKEKHFEAREELMNITEETSETIPE